MRKYPSFAALKAFEAAARLGSFKRAAEEISVSPTAVSHQVRQLEAEMGAKLFLRGARRTELTASGQAFADAVASPMRALADAWRQACQQSTRSPVNLVAAPLVSARWLLDRLPAFWQQFPAIDLSLHHSGLRVGDLIGDYDLAIAWGDGHWPGMETCKLIDVHISPVFAPAVFGADHLDPGDLLELPLLHHRDTAGWQAWLRAAGIGHDKEIGGTIFEDANILLQAATAGRGVALGFLPLVDRELACGQLVRPFDVSIRPDEAYYPIRQPGRTDSPAVRDTWDWLASQGTCNARIRE